jgi:hypothetical protein
MATTEKRSAKKGASKPAAPSTAETPKGKAKAPAAKKAEKAEKAPKVDKPAKAGKPTKVAKAPKPDTKPEIEAEPVAPELTDEERELAAVYGDEMSAPAAAHGEFKDQRTADEDRPMVPEINAREERNKRWEERRESRREERRGRRGRRHRGDRGDRPEAGGERPQVGERPAGAEHGARPPRSERQDRPFDRGDRPARPPVEPAPAPVVVGEGGAFRVGTELGEAAAAVFGSLRGGQPMPVKQLGAMMRKRGLFDADPETAWPHLKSALLADERAYRAMGLRPRIVYRGRDLFGPGPVTQSASGAAEANLASALGAVQASTHAALKARVAAASAAGFERVVDAYLTAAGYRELAWVKRVEGISYATALPPHDTRPIMISARAGDTPVDRRGIGELRVGVDAKGLLYGLLIAARELSDEAARELERPGRSIQALTGDALVAALIAAGVGVVTAAAPVRYVDDAVLDELFAG